MTTATPLKVSKTIKIGTGKKEDEDFRSAMESVGREVEGHAIGCMGDLNFNVSKVEREIDLVIMTIAELGIAGKAPMSEMRLEEEDNSKKSATQREVYERIRELGCEICPMDTAPELGSQYSEQPVGEFLIALSDLGAGFVFTLAHDKTGKRFSIDLTFPERRWSVEYRVAFVKPRK